MADPTLLERLTGVQIDDAGQAALLGAGFAAVILAGQLVFKLLRAIRRAATRPGRRAPRADMIATVIGAFLVLALSVEGMWEFFGSETVDMDGIARIAFCAVFEICLIAVALRARHIRLLRQARKDALIELRSKRADEDSSAAALDEQIASIRLRGINDLFVWGLATVIGVLAAFEATGGEQFLRFIVPFVATSMWELALSADVEDQRVTAAARHWVDRVKTAFVAFGRACASVAVKLGWVPPTSADATEQYREKRMTQLVDVSHKIHTSSDKRKPRLLDRQRRLILGLQARGQWTKETLAELGERLDVIFRAVELTAPAAVRTVPAPRPPKPTPAPAPAPRALPVPRPAPAAKRERKNTTTVDASAIVAAYERLTDESGRPPSVRELAAVTGYGKSTTAKVIKSHVMDMDNGQEQAA